MSKLLQTVTGALTHVSHDPPRIMQPRPILLAVSSAAPALPDHRSGYFWSELLHPYEAFSAAGYDCIVVSETGAATVDEASVTAMASGADKAKFDDGQFPLHTKLAQIRRPDQLGDASSYAAIFFAGGHGCCVDFPTAQGLQRLAASIYERGGVVGAVCHGVAIFDNLRLSNGQNLIQGKPATGFSQKGEEAMKLMDWMRTNNFETMETIVRRNGGDWSESSNPMGEFVKQSDRVVTGMNPASANAVAKQMISMLDGNSKTKGAGESAPIVSDSRSSSLKDRSGESLEADKQAKAYSGEQAKAL